MSSEAVVQAECMRALGTGPTRVFRNHTGSGWTGELVSRNADLTILRNARPCRFGLAIGGADLIGWRSLAVTPDMIGRQIALFLAVETKAPRGRLTEAQATFLLNVTAAGGLAGMARDAETARRIAGL